MNMAGINALVMYGYGINCDYETKVAFELSGANADRVHFNEVRDQPDRFKNYQIVALPGGFSFGDDISAGKILAVRTQKHLSDAMREFLERGGLIIGICNGYQALVKMGILPGFDSGEQSVTLFRNDSGRFEDRWVHLKNNPQSPCVFTQGIDGLYLPVRHGEGKFVPMDDNVLRRLEEGSQVVLRYTDENGQPTQEFPYNPNGSVNVIAGICNPTGRIFGLMPHPEAYTSPYQHPMWTRQKIDGTLPYEGKGLQIFRNAVDYFR